MLQRVVLCPVVSLCGKPRVACVGEQGRASEAKGSEHQSKCNISETQCWGCTSAGGGGGARGLRAWAQACKRGAQACKRGAQACKQRAQACKRGAQACKRRALRQSCWRATNLTVPVSRCPLPCASHSDTSLSSSTPASLSLCARGRGSRRGRLVCERAGRAPTRAHAAPAAPPPLPPRAPVTPAPCPSPLPWPTPAP